MELNLQRRMTGLREKIPDIQKTLDTVQFLKLRKVLPHGAMAIKHYSYLKLGRDRSHRNNL
jgi:hypothetical protein